MTRNGKDVPPELRELPAGRYVVEAAEDEAPALSLEEDAGIEAALESYRQGRVVDARRAREISPRSLRVAAPYADHFRSTLLAGGRSGCE